MSEDRPNLYVVGDNEHEVSRGAQNMLRAIGALSIAGGAGFEAAEIVTHQYDPAVMLAGIAFIGLGVVTEVVAHYLPSIKRFIQARSS